MKNKNPRSTFFSIIVPLYNKEAVIKTTLISALEQSYEHFELLVIDDGSSDKSVKLIQNDFNDDRIRLIQQENQGVSKARNHGIQESNGDWICFLDADDWWHPRHLEQISQAILMQTSAKFIGTAFLCQPDSTNWQPKAWELPKQPLEFEWINDLPSRWLDSIPFFTSSVCIKTSVFKQIDPWFVPGQSNGEDLDLWFRLAEKLPIFHLNRATVVYRTEQKSSLSQQTATFKLPYVIQQLQYRLKNDLTPNNLIYSSQKYINHELLTLARESILSKNRSQALKFVIQAKRAINTKRWWLTLFMVFFFPSSLILKWQEKRSGRQELIQ